MMQNLNVNVWYGERGCEWREYMRSRPRDHVGCVVPPKKRGGVKVRKKHSPDKNGMGDKKRARCNKTVVRIESREDSLTFV